MSFGPSQHLYLEGLPLQSTPETLRAIFAQYGHVLHTQVLEVLPGKVDRAAIVSMSSVQEAMWLVENVDNNIPVGLSAPIRVQFSINPPQLEGALPTPGFQAGAGAVAPGYAPGPPGPGMGAVSAPAPTGLGGGCGCGGGPGLGGMGGMPPAPGPGMGMATQGFQPQPGVMMSGTVKRWDTNKGFGFIMPDGGGPDVFVHARELADGEVLVNGARVMFEAMLDAARGPGRYRAKTCIGAIKKDNVPAVALASDRLFVVGLPADISEDKIKAVFDQYGSVVSVKKLPPQAGKMDAAALIKMGDVTMAKWLVDNVSKNIPTGLTTPITISFAENKVPAPSPGAPLATGGDGYGKALGMSAGPGGMHGPYGGHQMAPVPASGGWVPQL